mmetsp:Transcript_89605/g.145112  ORF Transcript_89605/g.145112 Transcript_89605/m.145112 type:complete len:268 (-) Transcript_89605:711-1514(-)
MLPSTSSSPSLCVTHTTGILMSSPCPVHLYSSSALLMTTMQTAPAAATRRALSTKGTPPRPTTTTLPLTSPVFTSSLSAISGSARRIPPSASSCNPNKAVSNAISTSACAVSPPPPPAPLDASCCRTHDGGPRESSTAPTSCEAGLTSPSFNENPPLLPTAPAPTPAPTLPTPSPPAPASDVPAISWSQSSSLSFTVFRSCLYLSTSTSPIHASLSSESPSLSSPSSAPSAGAATDTGTPTLAAPPKLSPIGLATPRAAVFGATCLV